MGYQDYLLKMISIIVLSVLFKQYAAPYLVSDEKYLVNKFLYNNHYSSVKPYLWLYVPLDENSRKWDTFNERKTNKLNIPYVEYCMETIILKNKDLFNICVVTDDDVGELIPEWNFRINELSEPVKKRVRSLAKLKLLYHYGGLVMPMSCLCLRSLRSLYSEVREPFMVQCDKEEKILGSRKGEFKVLEHINNIEIYVKDMSNETEFLNLVDMSAVQNLRSLDKKMFGVENKQGDLVTVKDLLGEGEIELNDVLYVIYFPNNEILKSTKYGWFSKISNEEIGESKMYVSKYWKGEEVKYIN